VAVCWVCRVFERDSARVVIDNESLKMIRGSVIDYHEELIRSAFRVVSNPQMEHGCSCGASFTVKLWCPVIISFLFVKTVIRTTVHDGATSSAVKLPVVSYVYRRQEAGRGNTAWQWGCKHSVTVTVSVERLNAVRVTVWQECCRMRQLVNSWWLVSICLKFEHMSTTTNLPLCIDTIIVLKITLLHSVSVITNFVIPKRDKQTKKHHTFSSTAGARSTITIMLGMVMEEVRPIFAPPERFLIRSIVSLLGATEFVGNCPHRGKILITWLFVPKKWPN